MCVCLDAPAYIAECANNGSVAAVVCICKLGVWSIIYICRCVEKFGITQAE